MSAFVGQSPTALPAVVGARFALATVCAAPILIAALILWLSPHPTVEADSLGYVQWSPDRSAPYPLFVKLVGATHLGLVQLLLFALSVSALAALVYVSLRSIAVTATVTLGIIANPQLWQLQNSILSEAITTPLVVLFSGALIAFVASRRAHWPLVAALLVGIAAVARPALLPLVIVPPTAVYLRRAEHRNRLALGCLLVFGICYAGNSLATYARHGANATSLAGRHLFAKSALLDADVPGRTFSDPLERRAAELAQIEYAPVRSVLRDAPRDARRFLQTSYELCLQYACTNDELAGVDAAARRTHDALFDVAKARIARDPIGLVALAADEYLALWTFHPQTQTSVVQAYRAFVAHEGPLPFQEQLNRSGAVAAAADHSVSGSVFRAGLAAIGILCGGQTIVLSLALLPRRRDDLCVIAFLCATGVQLVLIFDSLTGIGIPRYVIGVWPLIVLMITLPMIDVLTSLRTLFRNRSPA